MVRESRKDNDMDEIKTVPKLLRELAAAEHGIELNCYSEVEL